MLPIHKIIDLYDKQEYDTIINNLQITRYPAYYTNPQHILMRIISISNVELFAYIFSTDTVCKEALSDIIQRPILYEIFAYKIEKDHVLCSEIEKLINSNSIPIGNNTDFLNIILKYIPNISPQRLIYTFKDAITANNLDTIDSLFAYGFDGKSAFGDIIQNKISKYNKIKISTFVHLEKYNIDITSYIRDISLIYCCYNNLEEIIFCLRYGADINYLLELIVLSPYINVDTIKYLLENGADLNRISIKDIINNSNLDVIICLVEYGLDITIYIPELIFHAIRNNQLPYLIYLMNYCSDIPDRARTGFECKTFEPVIHIYDELYLFSAVYFYHTEIVEVLLNMGADINADDDKILLFSKPHLEKKLEKAKINFLITNSQNGRKLHMFNFLLNHGAVITDVNIVIQEYLRYSYEDIDEALIAHFIDLGYDLNSLNTYTTLHNDEIIEFKSMLEYMVCFYNTDAVKLLLKYGADISVNNYGCIRLAVKHHMTQMISILIKGNNIPTDILDLIEEKKINLNPYRGGIGSLQLLDRQPVQLLDRQSSTRVLEILHGMSALKYET